MKQLIAAVIIGTANIIGNQAFAGATIPVCNEASPTHSDPVHIFPDFDGDTDNPQLGRAWVDVEVLGDYVNADLWREEGHIKKKIEGLSMDPKTKNIVYQTANSQPIVCATFAKAGVFSKAMFHATGRCKFTARLQQGTVDSGFKLKKRPFVVVELTVN